MGKNIMNICIDCANCYADKCEVVRQGIGLVIFKCNNFVSDGIRTQEKICRVLEISLSTFHRWDFKRLKERARKRGYSLYKYKDDKVTRYILRRNI